VYAMSNFISFFQDNLNLPSLAIVGTKLKMPMHLGNSYPILQYGCNLIQSNPLITLVELFLTKYYDQYDDKMSRQMVLEAYHENATFSLSSCLLKTWYIFEKSIA